MTPLANRLGAIELIELGSPTTRTNLVFPELRMGGIADIAGQAMGGGGILDFFGNVLSTGFGTLADVVDAPLSALREGIGAAFTGLAGILRNIPILGEIVAALLLVINAAIQFVLKIPGFLLEQLGNAFKGLSSSFTDAFNPSEQGTKIDAAKKNLVNQAPAPIKGEVEQKIEAKPTTTPDDGLNVGGMKIDSTVLLVGAAAAVAAIVLT